MTQEPTAIDDRNDRGHPFKVGIDQFVAERLGREQECPTLVKYVEFEAIQVIQTCTRSPDIRRKGIVYDICCSMSVLDQQRQVRGLSEIGDSSSFFNWRPRKLGFHELSIGGIFGGLLLDLHVGEGCGRHAVDRHLILSVAEGIILLGGEDVLSRFDITAGLFVSAGGGRISRCFGRDSSGLGRKGIYILIRVLRLGILLALRRWNFAFNRKGYTVGARHTETGSIAADLFSGDGRKSANECDREDKRGDSLFEHGRSINRQSIKS